MHPAVVIGQLLIYCGELTGYGLTKVRLGHADGGSKHAKYGGYFVEEFEHPVVYIDLVKGEIGDKIR